jgi:hypothetical protein
MESVNGGNPYVGGVIAGWIGTFLYEVVSDWNGNVAAFKRGYYSVNG